MFAQGKVIEVRSRDHATHDDDAMDVSLRWGYAWLIAYDVMLFFLCVVAARMAAFYPGFAIFFITVALGLFVVLITSLISLAIVLNERRKAETRQKGNIVPGYCPDFWTKTFDKDKNIVCKNGFSIKDAHDRIVTYRFTDKKVPDTISLTEIAKSTNPFKCNMYDNPSMFPAPWLELKAKCELVTH